MQQRLAWLGYFPWGSCTGYYGNYTEDCLKKFQSQAGLEETGFADSETLRILYADNAPKCVQ